MCRRLIMGQYYRAVLGDANGNNRDVFDLTMWENGHKVFKGAKLMEMAWMGEGYPDTMEHQLYKSPHRVLWVGDYANELSIFNGPYKTIGDTVLENSNGANMPTYEEVWGDHTEDPKPVRLVQLPLTPAMDWEFYYLVNHDHKEYIPMLKYLQMATYIWEKKTVCIDPLPLLTAVGNENGSGDYVGADMEYVGSWAWNLISIERKAPDGYKEILPLFKEIME